MKKLVLVAAALLAALVITGPALAASLGMSPSKVEVQVPADGSRKIEMTAYYYNGDVDVSMVDIPLTVTPETIHVDALDNPEAFTITIHGDPSLGSKIYDGYIRFTGKSGEMIAVAVQVKAHVTNLVAGQEPVLATPATTATTAASIQPEVSSTSSSPGQSAQSTPPGGATVTTTSNSEGVIAGLSLNMVILIAAGLVFIGLIILAISFVGRRRRF